VTPVSGSRNQFWSKVTSTPNWVIWPAMIRSASSVSYSADHARVVVAPRIGVTVATVAVGPRP
jgi:hypothetical protein